MPSSLSSSSSTASRTSPAASPTTSTSTSSSTKMTFSTVFHQSSAGAGGMARGISFSFSAAGKSSSSSSSSSTTARATTTGSIGFTVVPSSQPKQPSHPVPLLPAASSAAASQSKGGKKATRGGGGRPRKVVVGGTVFTAAPQAAMDVMVQPSQPALAPLDWVDEATRDQFGRSSHCSSGEQLLVPTPVSCSSTSLGACTDGSNFTSSSTEPCPSFFGDDGGFGGAPEGFDLEEDTELMAFLQSSPLGPDDLTILPLSPPPRVKAVGTEARSSSGSTISSNSITTAASMSSFSDPSPLPPSEAPAPAHEKPPAAAARPKRAAASRGNSTRTRSATMSIASNNTTSSSRKGKGKSKAKEAAAKPTPAAATLAPLPSSTTRSFVNSPFQVVKQPASATGSPASPATAARFSFRELNERIRSPSMTAMLPAVRRSTSASSTASSSSTSNTSSSSSSSSGSGSSNSHRTIKTVLGGSQRHGTGAWSVCGPPPPPSPQQQQKPQQPQQQPQPHQEKHTAADLPMQPPLLLEGVSFHFEEDGDETGDEEFDVLAEGLAEDGPLSTSTLEILIEHFSSDGLGGDGAAFNDDDHYPYHHQQQQQQQQTRDAFGPSPQV